MKPSTGKMPAVRYSIKIKKSALKEIQKLQSPDRRRIVEAIDTLEGQPYAGKLLKGDLSGLRRLRVGHYRIIYEVYENEVIVLILRVSHRKSVYR